MVSLTCCRHVSERASHGRVTSGDIALASAAHACVVLVGAAGSFIADSIPSMLHLPARIKVKSWMM